MTRVILHADLDCFYCQVEQKRLDLMDNPPPLVVQQWNSVIAVNYEARSFGITRHLSTEECLEKCPSLHFVHVPTYALDDPTEPRFYAAWTSASLGGGGGGFAKRRPPCPDRRQHKACLDPYRRAGAQVLQAMMRAVSGGGGEAIVEKASVDEAFLDISRLVDERLLREYGVQRDVDSLEEIERLAWEEIGQPAEPSEQVLGVDCPLTMEDLRLFVGGVMAAEMRAAVKAQLGFTISVGIAPNKLLAKLASAMHKPNGQTYLLPRMVEAIMQRTPLQRLRMFGGKLGGMLKNQNEEDEDDEARGEAAIAPTGRMEVTAGSLWGLTPTLLGERVGDPSAGAWIHAAIRGIDETPVSSREVRDQFLAAKAFAPALRPGDWQAVQKWTRLLLAELGQRLEEEAGLQQRWPTKLTLGRAGHTRTLPMPIGSWELYKPEIMQEVCMREWRRWDTPTEPLFPCRQLSISVSRFRELKGPRDQSLDRYLRPRKAEEHVGDKREVERENALERQSPAPKRPRGLLAFFKPVPRPANQGHDHEDEEEWQCPECRQRVAPKDRQEHADYHLALSLSHQ